MLVEPSMLLFLGVSHVFFNRALFSGSLPKLIAESLTKPPLKDEIQFSKWEVWYADERYLPLDDAESNHKSTKPFFLCAHA